MAATVSVGESCCIFSRYSAEGNLLYAKSSRQDTGKTKSARQNNGQTNQIYA